MNIPKPHPPKTTPSRAPRRQGRHRSKTSVRANVSTILVHLAATWLEDLGEQECADYLREMRESINGVTNHEMTAVEKAVQSALKEYRIDTGRMLEHGPLFDPVDGTA